MTKRYLTRRQSRRIERIQEERAVRAIRRESRAVEGLEGGDLGPEQTDRVIAHFGAQVEVESVNGQVSCCHLHANLSALVTGDQVVWRAGNQGIGVIIAQLPRCSKLRRPDMHGPSKPVAANADRIVIVFAPCPEPHANLIDRYLTTAEHAGVQLLLLLNKANLVDESDAGGTDVLLNVYRTPGYPLVEVSVFNGLAVDELRGALGAYVSIFVGQSGIGKSSSMNALLSGVDARIDNLSTMTGKGAHTAITAQLFHFPDGGDLIDSPGIREFGLGHVSRDDVEAGLIEFHDLLRHCCFCDCRHDHEPGYALLQTLEDGRAIPQRMANHWHILASMPETDY